MAYTKTDWACGDKITAEKLNRMEQGIVDAQNGYECVEGWATLTEETVTTTYDSGMQANTGTLAYSQYIDVDKLKITFNGTEYELERTDGGPFIINYSSEDAPCSVETKDIIGTITNILIVPSEAGTYTVKIEVHEEPINTTECFEKAVNKVLPSMPKIMVMRSTSAPGGGGWAVEYSLDGTNYQYLTPNGLAALKADGYLLMVVDLYGQHFDWKATLQSDGSYHFEWGLSQFSHALYTSDPDQPYIYDLL